MRCFVLLCLLTASLSTVASQHKGLFRKAFHIGNITPNTKNAAKLDDPLFLTPLLEKGKIKEARELSRVSLGHRYGHSFSGFFTVNKKYNSNLFFWFFPSRSKAEAAPILVWLQGGPGGSSLFGIFVEHGPFLVDASLRLQGRNASWNANHNVLYIDNPVGTGFSFTNSNNGFARNEADVGRDLYQLMLQFYQLFPEIKNNELYVSGESYAGKYVPALTYAIHKGNKNYKTKINLKGMAIGDGLCDPISMTNYGDFLYNIGLVDASTREVFRKEADLTVRYIKQKQWIKAFQVFDGLLNGDKTGVPSYFTNVTGLKFYYNYLMQEEPKDMGYYTSFLNKVQVRNQIHVGNLTFNDGTKVERFLEQDIMQSVKPWIQEIMNNYRVMLYNGQLDVIIANSLTQNFIDNLAWKYSYMYKSAPRVVWKVGKEVAGYVKEVPGFVQVLVRNAGHMVPYDQPSWALDMITRFTSQKAFTSKEVH